MAVKTATGAKIYIGPINTTAETDTEYAALTYVQVKEVESMSEYGDQAAVITFASLEDGRARKAKGVRDAGDATLVVGNDPRDAGQLALIAAEKTNHSYAIKVVYPDAPDGNDTDSVDYFRALVGGARRAGLQNDQVMKRNYIFYITSAITEVPSAAVSGP